MDKRLAQIASRGLTLPEPTRLKIRKTGIFSRATVEPVFQEQARRWALRGEEAGGAVSSLGHYVGFCGATGEALTWTQRVQNFMPNGVHAIVIEPEMCRVQMFRYEHTYDVLITRHWLTDTGGRRPQMQKRGPVISPCRHPQHGALGQGRRLPWRGGTTLLQAQRR